MAARSQTEAALLIGITLSHMQTFGGEANDEIGAMLLAEPGQVFLRRARSGPGEDRWLRVAVDDRGWLQEGTSDLSRGEELRAWGTAERAERKAEKEQRAQEREARARHQAETEQANADTLERLGPLLTQLGIHPDTVRLGRRGIEVPGEALESLVRAAIERDEILGS